MIPSSPHPPTSHHEYGHKWYTMLAVSMGIFLSTIDASIVNVALPTLVRDLDTTFAMVQWVVLSYMLTVTTLMMSIGRLADMIGKKPLYTAGFIIFTISSVLCGLSPTIAWLIGFRVLQGVGAAMIMALGPAIITEAFPPSERGKALGIAGAVVSVGIVLGPAAGGVLTQFLSWHWIFFVNLPIGMVGIMIAQLYVTATQPAGGQRFDYPGAFTLFASLLCLLLALTLGQQHGFGEPAILLLFVGSLVFLIAFIITEFRSKHPIIDLRLFSNSLLSVNSATGFLAFILINGMLLLLPFYLEIALGYERYIVGLLLSSIPIALGIASPIAGSLSDRFGSPIITTIGLAIMMLGYVLISTLNEQTTAIGYMLRCAPIGIGMGIFQSPNNSAIMGAMDHSQLGVGSGLLALTRTLGQTTGVAALGAIWASRAVVHSGGTFQGEVSDAPPSVLIAALHDAAVVAIVIMILALGLSIWLLTQPLPALRQETHPERPTNL